MKERMEKIKDKRIKQLKKIKEIKIEDLEPLHHVGGFFNRLFAFLKEYSVIGIAIGVIVAQAAKDFVESMVSGVFIPLLNLLIPNNELTSLVINIGSVRFNIGKPLSSFITLLIIITFLYVIVNKMIKRENLELPEKKEDETSEK